MIKTRLFLIAITLGLLALQSTACQSGLPDTERPADNQRPEESVVAITPASEKPEGPALSAALTRDCLVEDDNFDTISLNIGELAVDFELKDSQGNQFRLSWLLAEKPVVMIFGSFT